MKEFGKDLIEFIIFIIMLGAFLWVASAVIVVFS